MWKLKKLYSIMLLFNIQSYILIPLIPLYMKDTLNVDLVIISFVLGACSIISSIFCFIGPSISNKIGNKNSLILAIISILISYILFLIPINIFIISILFIILQGIARICWQPVIKTTLSFYAKEYSISNVFGINYILICISGIIGPLFNITITNNFYYNTTISSIIGVLALVLIFTDTKILFDDVIIEQISLFNIESIKLKSISKSIFAVLSIGFSVFMVFSIFENVLPITLNTTNKFSLLLMINSVLGIIIQLLVVKFLNKVSNNKILISGFLFFSISFIMFGYSVYIDNLFGLIFATILFTLAETFTVPSLDSFTDEYCNEEEKLLFFSLSEIRNLGFLIGPLLFSYILKVSNSTLMFLFAALITLILGFMMLWTILSHRFKIQKGKM